MSKIMTGAFATATTLLWFYIYYRKSTQKEKLKKEKEEKKYSEYYSRVGWVNTVDPNGYIAPKMHISMYAENRQKLIQRFKKLNNESKGEAIVLEGGNEINLYDTDVTLLFRQESNFYYLFGINEPGCYGVIDLEANESLLFIPRLDVEYAVWLGSIKPLLFYQQKYGVNHVYYVDELAQQLQQRGIKKVYTLSGQNSDSKLPLAEAKFSGKQNFEIDNSVLYGELAECRVIKSEKEIEVLRHINNISSQAHIEVMRQTKEGMMEYELESIFKYQVGLKGCRQVSYTCICCSGKAGSVLHYGHAGAPNDKTVHKNEMLLLDMGGEYHGYSSDITCSFPSSGKFTDQQKQIYETVLAAQKAVISKMRPGVLWSDMHRLAERVICENLIKHGFINPQDASIDELVCKHHIVALFMPHGLGHLLGMDVHDVGGYPAHEAKRIDEPGIRRLRMNRVLQPGMFLTVEPGVYFIEALLGPAMKNPNVSPFLNADKISQFMDFGGVRLEDDVLVTSDGCENLTKCPRTVEEVEAVMRGQHFLTKHLF